VRERERDPGWPSNVFEVRVRVDTVVLQVDTNRRSLHARIRRIYITSNLCSTTQVCAVLKYTSGYSFNHWTSK